MNLCVTYKWIFLFILVRCVRSADKQSNKNVRLVSYSDTESDNEDNFEVSETTGQTQEESVVIPYETISIPYEQREYVSQQNTQYYLPATETIPQPINYYDHPQPINQPYVPQFQPTPQTGPVQYYVPTIIPPVPVLQYELSPHPMTQQPALVQPYQLYVPAQITPQPQPIQQIPLQHRPYQHTAHHQFRTQYRGPRGTFRQEYHGPRYPRYRPPYYQPIRYGPPVYSYQQLDDYQNVQPVNNYGTPPIAERSEQSETTDKVKELQPELVKLELGSDSEDEYDKTTKGPEGIDKLSVEQPSQTSDQPSKPLEPTKELEPEHIPVEVKSDDEESISEPKKTCKEIIFMKKK